MRNFAISCLLVLGFAVICSAQIALKSDSWAQWNSLVGVWVGEGSGEPGQGSGGSAFSFDLQGRVLVRRSFADYPATKNRPAYRHDDVMFIYVDPANQKTRAIFFDSEGHVIHYAASVSADGSTFQFLSDPQPSESRFRFTYAKDGPSRFRFQFEIAPAGSPEKFGLYIQGAIRRKAQEAK